jgi:transcriptional regulator with GAF, ATPase, and Fis domain
MPAMEKGLSTTRVVDDLKHPRLMRRKLQVEVLKGPDTGKKQVFGAEEINIGTLNSNDVVLTDSAVSRYHLRIAAGIRGFVISDLDSTNGTFIGGLRVGHVTLTSPTEVRLGESNLRLSPLTEEDEVPLHPAESYGGMLGRSPQMRALFAQLNNIANSEATVLIEGETGTGKELLAEEIHGNSPRAKGPFIVADCGAIPEHLMESELFGHLKGSFTSAHADRTGAFELSDGGTLFLDEIGELSAAAQPKLLRALENRQVKPVGSGRYKPINVRIIAATNRDLRLAVNESTFRADLFYRLSVVRLRLPPLRERPEDVEALAAQFMAEFWERMNTGTPPPPLSPETVQRLVNHRWPGNVRELRNFMERVVVLARAGADAEALKELEPEPLESPRPEGSGIDVDVDLPYKDAKMKWVDHFEMTYVAQLLDRNGGNVAAAAREAGVDRTYFFRLIRKYALKR